MKDNDQIKELFSKKLGNHESTVRPELWNGIASQITTGASASVGVSVLTKIIISTISVAAISTAVVLYSTQDSKIEKEIKTIENDSKMIVLEEKEPVFDENKTISPLIEDKEEIIINSEQNSEIELNEVIIQQNESTLSEEDNSNTQKGVLKERAEEPKNNLLENSITSNENSQNIENEISEDITEFPIELDKENLVEGYTISKMPDVFSPNNDGQNDLFFITSDGISDFSIVIMDQNSNVVYKSSDVDFKWNGIDLYGNPVETGQYVYFITGNDRNGNSVSKYQSLTIVR